MPDRPTSEVSADGSQLLRARLAQVARTDAASESPPADAAAGDGGAIPSVGSGSAPLTPTQAGLWFDHRVEPTDPAHHRPTVLRLLGPLDADALAATLAALVRRHAALRTSYPLVDGRPVQLVH